ncbi:uncharacterized protein [Bemisia tabaci]|uniref:uncharacterized protein isoform X2 n=1 Tax=Bemisia tabaci TaxID=7038 RepID=UPI003B289698
MNVNTESDINELQDEKATEPDSTLKIHEYDTQMNNEQTGPSACEDAGADLKKLEPSESPTLPENNEEDKPCFFTEDLSKKGSLSELLSTWKIVNSNLSFHSSRQNSEPQQKNTGGTVNETVTNVWQDLESRKDSDVDNSENLDHNDHATLPAVRRVDLNVLKNNQISYPGAHALEETIRRKKEDNAIGVNKTPPFSGHVDAKIVKEETVSPPELKLDVQLTHLQVIENLNTGDSKEPVETVEIFGKSTDTEKSRAENNSQGELECRQLDEIIQGFEQLGSGTRNDSGIIKEILPLSKDLQCSDENNNRQKEISNGSLIQIEDLYQTKNDSFEQPSLSAVTPEISNLRESNSNFSNFIPQSPDVSDGNSLECPKTQAADVERGVSQVHVYENGKNVTSQHVKSAQNNSIHVLLGSGTADKSYHDFDEKNSTVHFSTEVQEAKIIDSDHINPCSTGDVMSRVNLPIHLVELEIARLNSELTAKRDGPSSSLILQTHHPLKKVDNANVRDEEIHYYNDVKEHNSNISNAEHNSKDDFRHKKALDRSSDDLEDNKITVNTSKGTHLNNNPINFDSSDQILHLRVNEIVHTAPPSEDPKTSEPQSGTSACKKQINTMLSSTTSHSATDTSDKICTRADGALKEKDACEEISTHGVSEETLPKPGSLSSEDRTKVLDFVELNLRQAEQLCGIIHCEGGSAGITGKRSSLGLQMGLRAGEDCDDRKLQNKESKGSKFVTFSVTTMIEEPVPTATFSATEAQSQPDKFSRDEDLTHSASETPKSVKDHCEREQVVPPVPGTVPATQSKGFSGQTLFRSNQQNSPDGHRALYSNSSIGDAAHSKVTNPASLGRVSNVLGTEIPKGLVKDKKKVIEEKSGTITGDAQKLSKKSFELLRETVNIKNSRERYIQEVRAKEGISGSTNQQNPSNGALNFSRTSSSLDSKPKAPPGMVCGNTDKKINPNFCISSSENQGNFEVTEKQKMKQILKSSVAHHMVDDGGCVDAVTPFEPLRADISALNAAASEQGEHFISVLATPTPEKTPSSSQAHIEQGANSSASRWKGDRDQQDKPAQPLVPDDDEAVSGQITHFDTARRKWIEKLDSSRRESSKDPVGGNEPRNHASGRMSTPSLRGPSSLTQNGSEVDKCSKTTVFIQNEEEKAESKSSEQFISKKSSFSVSSRLSRGSENGGEYRNTLSRNDVLSNDPNQILKAIVTNKMSSQRMEISPSFQTELKQKTANSFCTKDAAGSTVISMNLKSGSPQQNLTRDNSVDNARYLKNLEYEIGMSHACDENKKEFKLESGAIGTSRIEVAKPDVRAQRRISDDTLDSRSGSRGFGTGETEKEVKVIEAGSKEGTNEFLILCQYYSLVESTEPMERSPEGDTQRKTETTENGGKETALEAQVHVRLSPALTQMLSQPNLPAAALKSGVEMVTITSEATLPHWSRLNLVATCQEFCRICHDTAGAEDFISPCQCRGSLSRVHKFCLERWLAESDTSACELCGHRFQIVRVPRYSIIDSIVRWFKSQENVRDVRELFFDMIALCAFTPMIIGGSYFGFLVAETVYQRMISSTISRAASFTLVSMMTGMDLAFLTWFALRTQHHTMQWYGWWRRNSVVKIIVTEQNQPRPRNNVSCDDQPPT